MNWHNFRYGFWHPFGPYCDLSCDEILAWKAQEVITNGWTFWSFAYTKAIDVWAKIITAHAPTEPVYVLCSYSPTAKDPAQGKIFNRATNYKWVDTSA